MFSVGTKGNHVTKLLLGETRRNTTLNLLGQRRFWLL
jgi:hypothetical protein